MNSAADPSGWAVNPPPLCHRSRLDGELTVARPPRRLLASTDVPHTDVLRCGIKSRSEYHDRTFEN